MRQRLKKTDSIRFMIDHTTTKMTDGGSLSDREEYYNHIEVAVDSIEEERKGVPEESLRPLSEEIWQSVDSSKYIIYYDYNIHVLRFSNNEPHDWKHLIADDDSWRDIIQAMAYRVMEQDLWDEVQNRDLD